MAEKKSKNLFLVGDSTIDNLVWVDKKEDCIHSKLIERLPEFEITNFSADGFTSQNVLDGACPNISRSQRRKIGDPFPDEDHFAPLVYLESTALSLEKEHYCVLSIGGNDIREILGSMGKLQQKIGVFHQNYPKIVQSIVGSVPKLILMLQYRPALDQDASHYGVYKAMKTVPFGPEDPLQKLNFLMQMIYPPIFGLASQLGLPIIDLPNTMDPRNPDLFRCQIEPSASGGEVISEMIQHVLKTHDYSKGESLFYSKKGDKFVSTVNSGAGWQVEN